MARRMADKNNPFVSVIIPVYNDLERLKICVEALVKQTYPQDNYEIIVVDNGSAQSPAADLATYKSLCVVQETSPGSFAARNKGAQVAQGNILAFTDSDCIPAADWIEKGAAYLHANPQVGLIGGRVKVFAQNPQHPTAAELCDLVTAFPQKRYIEKLHFSVTANLFTTKTVFESVGPFNEKLKSGGDLEWGQRVFAHGYQLIYAPDVCVAHPARKKISQIQRKARRVAGGLYDKKKDSRSLAKLILGTIWAFVPPLTAWREALTTMSTDMSTHYSWTDKAKVSYIVLLVNYTMAIERVRLAMGGTSEKV